jgi:hypothetical protein
MVTKTRQLSVREHKLLERMFSQLPCGADDLRRQLQHAEVSTIDEEGSIRFFVASPDRTNCITNRVPVTGIFDDDDGVPIYLLLHVGEGQLRELEVYKADGSRMITRPEPEKLYF